jgi:2-polyprenyl-3-methyl-5-hydroxy-6-metoxy-1,4-benzoquinol methylase
MTFDRSLLEARKACPLCDTATRSIQWELDGFHIVNCNACGFKYVLEVASEDANVSYYEGGYSGDRHKQGQEVNASINVDILSRLGLVRGKRLLDIGSGFGFFAARARDDLGMTVFGAELSASERAYAEQILKVPTYASLQDIPSGERFDIISMMEVIEHIRDPKGFLRSIAPLLSDKGVLLIGTDNFESAAVRRMGVGFPKWIPNQHISLFSPVSLRRLATSVGSFVPLREFSYTPWEYWARIFVIMSTGGRKGVKKFRLADELASEDSRGYKFFSLRKAVNALYARLARRQSLNASMMYAAFQRV